jgi:hypothetical protein
VKFNETFELILEGKKTQTTRPVFFGRRYLGLEGKETFARARDGRKLKIRIEAVFECKLGKVAEDPGHYRREGFESGEEFIAVWKKLYGRSSWKPEQIVVVIRFHKLEGPV